MMSRFSLVRVGFSTVTECQVLRCEDRFCTVSVCCVSEGQVLCCKVMIIQCEGQIPFYEGQILFYEGQILFYEGQIL
jgi:hypothetical protein